MSGEFAMPQARRSSRYRAAGAGVIALILAASALAAWRWVAPRPAIVLLLRQAADASAAQDYATAARLLDEVLGREPANRRALLARGEVARDQNNRAAAQKYWSMIPDTPPSDGAVARCSEGMLAYTAFEARRAEPLFLRAKQLDPAYLKPRERLAHLYKLQLRDAELRRELIALRAFRPLTLEELSRTVGNLGKVPPAPVRVKDLERLIASDDGDVLSVLALGESFLGGSRIVETIKLLERWLERHPGELAVRGLLVESLLKTNRIDRAWEALREQTPADDAPVWFLRACGDYSAAVGDWETAATYLGAADDRDPEDIPTAHTLGMALSHLGRRDEAESVLDRARRMEQLVLQAPRIRNAEPQAIGFMLPIAVEIARLLLELRRAGDALPWIEQALEWEPSDADVRALYARAVSQSQMPEANRAPPRSVAGVHKPLRSPSAGASSGRAAMPIGQSPAPIRLVDRHREAGIEFQYRNGASGFKYLLESPGGGLAAFDFDGDGWPDLYFAQGSPLPVGEHDEKWPDCLFQNVGGTFRDVTLIAGLGDTQYSQGCAAGDYDNDGFADLAVANFGSNVLYHNNGDGTFRDVTQGAGIEGEHWYSSLAFADLDRDGFLDLYVVTYVADAYRICGSPPDRFTTCSLLNYKAEQDQPYHNRGDGSFEAVSAAAGITAEDGKGLGIVIADLDDDGRPDVYVTNDGTPNFLYHNQTEQPGAPLRLEERGLAAGAAVTGSGYARAGMGIACGDFDGDGLLDLFVTNFYLESATLYVNQGDLLFVDETRSARLDELTRQFLGFGTQPIDVDLDGRLDLFIANGHVDDFRARGEP